MFPRPLVPGGARARQREVPQVKTLDVSLQLAPSWNRAGKDALNTRFQRLSKPLGRQRPSRGIRLAIETFEERGVDHGLMSGYPFPARRGEHLV